MIKSNLKFKAFASLLLFILLSTHAISQESIPALVKRVARAVVVITTYDLNGATIGQASGFFINSSAEVITNYHVMNGAVRAEVKTIEGKIYSVKGIVAEDQISDLIKLILNEPPSSVSCLTHSWKTSEVGEKILVIGSPLGLEQTVSDGIVSAVRDVPPHGKVIQITAPVSSGSSGSPVINLSGNLIGVVSFQYINGQNLNFIIPVDKVTELKSGTLQPLKDWTTAASKQRSALLQSLLLQAWRKFIDQDYWGALGQYEQATNLFPESVKAFLEMGNCLAELHRFQEAMEAYKKALSINPNDSEVYYCLGRFYGKLDRTHDEIDAYKIAIQLNPNYWPAHSALGSAYLKIKEFRNAIEEYKKSILITPDYGKVIGYLQLGRIYERLRQFSNAIEVYKQILLIAPAGPEAYLAYSNLSTAYEELGLYQDAIDVCKQMIRLNPNASSAYGNLSSIYEKLGRYPEALEMCNKVRQIDPDDSMAYTCFGDVYSKQGNYDLAIAAYKQAIQKNPQDGQIYFDLAMLYIKLGQRHAALEQYRVLREVDPELADLLFELIRQ